MEIFSQFSNLFSRSIAKQGPRAQSIQRPTKPEEIRRGTSRSGHPAQRFLLLLTLITYAVTQALERLC